VNRTVIALGWCTLIALSGIGLGGCAYPNSPQSHTDRATVEACRAQASQLYDQTNRGDIYTISQTGAPYSGSYLPSVPINELANRYHNEQIVDDCVRNTGTETNRSDAPPPAVAKP
jgi:hypothetical protein